MKRYLVLFVIVSLAVVATQAQVLNVKVGPVTYVHRAANAGDMPFTQGTTLTIEGKAYQVGDACYYDKRFVWSLYCVASVQIVLGKHCPASAKQLNLLRKIT